MSRIHRFLFLILLMLALPSPALAQAAEYRLQARRNWGYGAGANVRGNFSLTVSGAEENIQSVSYWMDGEEIYTTSEAPFKYSYKTSQYSDGWHDLSAVVTKKDGTQVTTPVVRLNYLSAEQESGSMQRLLIPLFGGIMLAMAIGVGVQYLAMRRGSKTLVAGAPRSYGIMGGAICPHCGRPYPRHIWGINISIAGKLDRCDFCGKWAVVKARSPQELAAAEQAERDALAASDESMGSPQNEEERTRKLLDESKYM
jgi:Bacterial Ig domain